MPELPEVETTLRGIEPHIAHQTITNIVIRNPHLRWPVPTNLPRKARGKKLLQLTRRGKYILFHIDTGTIILHLGMSGRVRVLSKPEAPKKHDHIDICFSNNHYLRFTDPRRFGALLWTEENPDLHPLLAHIGPEPLTPAFNASYLHDRAKNKKVGVKSYIMDGKIVAGVGNIYAAEALFEARIHPETPAGKVSLEQYKALVTAIKAILKKAIKKGGTTLKDFKRSDGSPGYFSIDLKVYGRDGQPCVHCSTPLKLIRMGQRSTVYCPHCQ